jgi:hypothetical protein
VVSSLVRKESGSVFVAYAKWRIEDVEVTGTFATSINPRAGLAYGVLGGRATDACERGVYEGRRSRLVPGARHGYGVATATAPADEAEPNEPQAHQRPG